MLLIDKWLDAERKRATDGFTGTTLRSLTCSSPVRKSDVDEGSNDRREEFGYELLLSDVSRAYCGYDSSYFDNADEAIQEAAIAREKVLSRETLKPSSLPPTTSTKENSAAAADDRWALPSCELSDCEFEARLRNLRSQFSTDSTSPLSLFSSHVPTEQKAFKANPTTTKSSEGAGEQQNNTLKTTSFNGKDVVEPLIRNDDTLSALQHAFLLAQQPVEPALQFPPLESI